MSEPGIPTVSGDDPQRVATVFPDLPEDVARARRFVHTALTRAGITGSVLEDAQLLVSELVTNAFQHACSPVRLTVEFLTDTTRVSVTDLAPDLPRPKRSDVMSETGRGLFVVEKLSLRWGTRLHDGVKTVWFDVPLRSDAHECPDPGPSA